MEDAIKNLEKVSTLLAIKSRVHTLEFLNEPYLKKKLEISRKSYDCIYLSKTINDYMVSTYNNQLRTISWISFFDDLEICFDDKKQLSLLNLENFHLKLDSDINIYFNELNKISNESLMHSSIDFILSKTKSEILKCLSNDKLNRTKTYNNIKYGGTEPHQFLKLPNIVKLDPIYEPKISVLNKPQVKFSQDSYEINVEFFWNLGIREILAAEICALSIFEYDGFPVDFYYDFLKQMWDESRHANYYLNKSISMFPKVIERGINKELIETIENYNLKGKLPIPKEKNFIETFIDATIEERIVLLNIRTEAPAVARLKDKINSKFCEENLDIKQSFSMDRNDEISHGSIGYKWFKFLYPKKEDRALKLEEVDSMRGLLLFISLSEYSEKNYIETINDVINENESLYQN